jgi:purine-binding chemotaxis protein CheW
VELGLLTFELGQRRYAVPLEFVREVLAAGAVTPVPGAPAWVRGMLNARGLLAPMLDLLVMTEHAQPRTPRLGDSVVLVEVPVQPWSDGQPPRAGILVDHVERVVPPEEDPGACQRLDVPALLAEVRFGIATPNGVRR